nr:heme-binding protein [Brevundimonas variabilis]
MPALVAVCFGFAVTPALAQTPPVQAAPAPAPVAAPPYGLPIGLADAQALIDRAMAEAARSGFRMAIAVVEPSGELVAFARMDDTQYGSIFVAQRKAEYAARYRLPTAVAEERVQAGRVVSLANPEAFTIGGGIPIVRDGKIVGAIGVSGATAAQDAAVAEVALAGN